MRDDLPAPRQRALVTQLDDISAALHWAFGPDGDPGHRRPTLTTYRLDLAEQALVCRMP